MSVEYFRQVEGCWEVEPKWHPRMVFLTFLWVTIVTGMAVFILVNHLAHWGHRIPDEGWLVLLAIIGLWLFATAFGVWDNRGNAVRWDNDAIYVRQCSQWGRGFSRFARIPYGAVESIERRGKPPHEPRTARL